MHRTWFGQCGWIREEAMITFQSDLLARWQVCTEDSWASNLVRPMWLDPTATVAGISFSNLTRSHIGRCAQGIPGHRTWSGQCGKIRAEAMQQVNHTPSTLNPEPYILKGPTKVWCVTLQGYFADRKHPP